MSRPESGTSVPKAGTSMLERMRAKARAHTKAPGPRCAVCALRPDMLSVLRELKSEGITNTALSRTLTDEGQKITANTVSRHFLDHERQG